MNELVSSPISGSRRSIRKSTRQSLKPMAIPDVIEYRQSQAGHEPLSSPAVPGTEEPYEQQSGGQTVAQLFSPVAGSRASIILGGRRSSLSPRSPYEAQTVKSTYDVGEAAKDAAEVGSGEGEEQELELDAVYPDDNAADVEAERERGAPAAGGEGGEDGEEEDGEPKAASPSGPEILDLDAIYESLRLSEVEHAGGEEEEGAERASDTKRTYNPMVVTAQPEESGMDLGDIYENGDSGEADDLQSKQAIHESINPMSPRGLGEEVDTSDDEEKRQLREQVRRLQEEKEEAIARRDAAIAHLQDKVLTLESRVAQMRQLLADLMQII